MNENDICGIVLNETVEWADSFRDLFKRQKYEKYIYDIISKSNMFFSNRTIKPIKSQSNGEADYEDNYGNKYDVKVVMNKQQGALLGDRKNEMLSWFSELNRECKEYWRLIEDGDLSKVKSLTLYSIIKDRLKSISKEEIPILFFPFHITLDNKHSVYGQFGVDIIQAVYDQLDEEGLINDKEIYFIYPSMDKSEYVLRDGQYHREYIQVPELDSEIVFETKL